MPAQIFDWRDDPSGTMCALPQVRARFIRRMPGSRDEETFHTHEESDGIEAWVVLEGKVRFEFEIDGERREVVAGPGQAVFALPDEKHRISCAGDEPCVYFLTVSPHRAPTHTHYDAQGNRRPTTPGAVRPTWKGEPAIGVDGRGLPAKK
jgi:mannose-6-phosphate isomerase-like protein (cupin superfamily)